MAEPCKNCKGSGDGQVFNTLPCPYCKGSGHVEPSKPQPVRLSAEMLGEEDREAWEFAKQVLLDFRTRMDALRIKTTVEIFQRHYERERDMAHEGVLLILRLLNPREGE